MRLRIILLLLLVSAGAVRTGGAATWYLEKDGSGDFTVIQDAVDAAASGDTVRIGPGNYNDGHMVHTAGWNEFVRVLVHQEELTIIGAGPEVRYRGIRPLGLHQLNGKLSNDELSLLSGRTARSQCHRSSIGRYVEHVRQRLFVRGGQQGLGDLGARRDG